MNILAQSCGIVLMLVVLYFHSTQKKIHLHTERAFMGIWKITFASLVLDILSMVLLTYRDILPQWFVLLGCKTYIISLVWVAIFYVNYIYADIYKKYKEYKRSRLWLAIIGFLFTAAVSILPLYVCTESAEKTYTYGPAANVAYCLAALVLILLGYLLHKFKAKVNPRRRRVMWFWMAVWSAAALIEFVSIEFLETTFLLVGYASAVGTVILYLRLENPEANLDRMTGFFNQNAFLLYTGQLLDQKKDFILLDMVYSLGIGDNIPADTEEIVLMEISRFISKIEGIRAFRISENELVFLFFDEKEEEQVYKYLSERFEKPWGRENMRIITPRWYCVEHAGAINRAEDLLTLFQYTSQKLMNSRIAGNEKVLIDRDVIKAMYKEQEVENLLIHAMEMDWVDVYFQPIYSTRKYQFVSAEALVRIHDAEGKIISPAVFIEVAEKTGLIVKLGEMVFEKVCRFIREEKPSQYGIEYIEVNLSVIQCGYEYLAENFIRTMKKYDILPGCINLEITETASLKEKRTLLRNMKELREYGVSFSLDDFGTGRSNLNYIVDMPVDIVKFDKDMIQSYFSSDKAKYVMDAAMHMIHGMELQIVSEGIETEEQYVTMEKLGISFIQGYYFSKPLPEKEFLKFIRQQKKGISDQD